VGIGSILVKIDHRINSDEKMVIEMERYKSILKHELQIFGKGYDDSLSLYDNMFHCSVSGCTFRNIYYIEYVQHMEEDKHCHDPRKGTDMNMSKLRMIDDAEETEQE
jgi:hypothetical protein